MPTNWIGPSGKWIVDIKGRADYAASEISVLREDYTLGIRSFGWFFNDRKLVIYQSSPADWSPIPLVWDKLVKMAEEIAAELNAAESK